MPDGGEIKTTFETDTYSHPDTTTETDLVEYTGLKNYIVTNLDMSNFGESTTVRVYDKVDGTNYRQVSQKIYPDDYETGTEVATFVLDGAGQDMKVTLQSAVAEGGATSVPADIRSTIRL